VGRRGTISRLSSHDGLIQDAEHTLEPHKSNQALGRLHLFTQVEPKLGPQRILEFGSKIGNDMFRCNGDVLMSYLGKLFRAQTELDV